MTTAAASLNDRTMLGDRRLSAIVALISGATSFLPRASLEAAAPVAIAPRPMSAPTLVDVGALGSGPHNVGPGSLLSIWNGSGFVGCTANFVWQDGTKYYLGTAGHCVLPNQADTTHGPGVRFDKTRVQGSACVDECLTADPSFVRLGQLAYGRRRLGTEEVGNDFAVFEVPTDVVSLLRPAIPVWSGPATEGTPIAGTACMYGFGAYFKQRPETHARAGALLAADGPSFVAALPAANGDSGAAVELCDPALGATASMALGILTHIVGVIVTSPSAEPAILGTTVARAEAMATEAGLHLHVVTA